MSIDYFLKNFFVQKIQIGSYLKYHIWIFIVGTDGLEKRRFFTALIFIFIFKKAKGQCHEIFFSFLMIEWYWHNIFLKCLHRVCKKNSFLTPQLTKYIILYLHILMYMYGYIYSNNSGI